MRVLLVHPSALMYSEIFLRLEPLGLELVAEAARQAGHEVRLVDLQADTRAELTRIVEAWAPEAVGFSLNYLANVPEVLELAAWARARRPKCLVFAGGHSASFIPEELLAHAAGTLDCVVRGEGEGIIARLLAAAGDRERLHTLPGVTTSAGAGPAPGPGDLDALRPARDLLAHRRRYFIGVLDPCASIEFTRGCPWDCAFCSAWTFYGRGYRTRSPAEVADELARIWEPGVFVVDDVAFVQAEHGLAIADAVERRRVRKRYYMETRADVLLRNPEVFRRWRRLGLEYLFLGLEAIDEDGLRAHRKRISLGKSFEALDVARSLGLTVAVNLIADPGWDARRFEVVREWARSVPEIVHLTVNTPYPGTESWHTEPRQLTTRDYRLFDVQHAVLPTRLPLPEFYRELVRTQQVLDRKHLGFTALRKTLGIAAGHLVRGQTNFLRMLWKFGSVYDGARMLQDHQRPCRYAMGLPPPAEPALDRARLYVLRAARNT